MQVYHNVKHPPIPVRRKHRTFRAFFTKSLPEFFLWESRLVNAPIEAADIHQFQGGSVEIGYENAQEQVVWGDYDIDDNDFVQHNDQTVARITLATAPPDNADRFKLLSDDDGPDVMDKSKMAPDITLLNSFLAPAFIFVSNRTDLSPNNADTVNQENVDFVLNLGGDGGVESMLSAARGIIGHANGDQYEYGTRQSVADPYFWVAYVLGGFQPYLGVDGDRPDGDTLAYVPGATIDIVDPGKEVSGDQWTFRQAEASLLFRETLRDEVVHRTAPLFEETIWKVAAVHEVLHQLGLDDKGEGLFDHGSIMDIDAIMSVDMVSQLKISHDGYRRLRAFGRWPGDKV